LHPNAQPLEEAQRQLSLMLQQQEELAPALYRDLALYLQVLREGLLPAVQQACFHLATQVVPERYAQLPQQRRLQFQQRLAALVQRCNALLTVEQVMGLAAQQQRREHRRRAAGQQQLLQAFLEGQAHGPTPTADPQPQGRLDPAPQPPSAGSIHLGLDLPLSADLFERGIPGLQAPSARPGMDAAKHASTTPPAPGSDQSREADDQQLQVLQSLFQLAAEGLRLDQAPLTQDGTSSETSSTGSRDASVEASVDALLDGTVAASRDAMGDGPWDASPDAPDAPEGATEDASGDASGDALDVPPESASEATSEATSEVASVDALTDASARDRFMPDAFRPPVAEGTGHIGALELMLTAPPDPRSTGSQLPRDPLLQTLWWRHFDRALSRRLRNLSHALNVEMMRLGLAHGLLPLNLLDAVLDGQVEAQPAPPNLLRLPLPLADGGDRPVDVLALLLRPSDLEFEQPRLRTCRKRLEQRRRALRTMAKRFRIWQRRVKALEAEQQWFRDSAQLQSRPQPPS
jgi:hypothetical protein